jgi:hypothetical protein
MAMHCEKCGAEVEAGWPVCRKCFEPVKRQGFFSRLRRLFSGINVSVSIGKSVAPMGGSHVKVNVSQRYKIKDSRTGEVREYHSLEEVPEEFREKLRLAQEAALDGKTINKISVTDASGQVKTYNSIEELPPELRALYEKANPPDRPPD